MKNKFLAGFLAIFLGAIGVHKFYLDRPGQGFLYFLFCWSGIPMIISLFEGLYYFGQSQASFDAKYNVNTYASLNNIGDIETLAVLLERGHLTREEFEEKKRIILNKIK